MAETTSSRFAFLRFFGGNSNRGSLRKGDSQDTGGFRRTRSLCDSRAGVSSIGLISGLTFYQQQQPGLVTNTGGGFTGAKRRIMPLNRRDSVNSMDRSKSPGTTLTVTTSSPVAFSSLVPLPVEVVQLCESAFGRLYCPYDAVRWTLLDQIRRVFYADCNGDVQHLCHSFLAPAANLLDAIRKGSKNESSYNRSEKSRNSCSSWPLCVDGKVVIHLTELDRSQLPTGKLGRGDFYFHLSRPVFSGNGKSRQNSTALCLCLKLRTLSGESLEVRIPASRLTNMAFSQRWFQEVIFRGSSDTRLLSALQFCVVSFERSIDRIELQLLASGVRSGGGGQRLLSVAGGGSGSSLTSGTPDTMTGPSSVVVSSNLLSVRDNELFLSTGCLLADECQCLCGIINSTESTAGNDGHLLNRWDHRNSQYPAHSQHSFPAETYHPSELSKSINLSGHGNLITALQPDSIQSGGMVFPGILDRQQHPVVFVFAQRFPAAVTAGHITDLFGYYYSIAREAVSKNGFTLVVDSSVCVAPLPISQDVFLEKLDTAMHQFEEKFSSGIHRVLIIVQSETPIEKADQIRDSFVKTPSGKLTFVHGKDDLRMQIDDMNILTELDGRLSFDHQKFVSYRKEIEPFIETCRLASRRLLEAMQDLKLQDRCVCQCNSSSSQQTPAMPQQTRSNGSGGCSSARGAVGSGVPHQLTHVITAKHYRVMIEAQKMMQLILEDQHLLRLQMEGDGMLQRFQADQISHETKDSYDQAAQLYNEVITATVKLAKLADKRLQKLEKCHHIKRLDEDTRKILSWIRWKGEETLQRHIVIADNLAEVRQQQQELEAFYFVASKQLDKATNILHDFQSLNPADYPAGIAELYRCLRDYHKKFSERLEATRERTDEAARCYCLVERSFEWTLSTINFMSHFRLESGASLDQLNEHLRKMERYMVEHPALSDENFREMDQIASRLKIAKLSDNCLMARLRSQEASALADAKQNAFLKAKFVLAPAIPQDPQRDGLLARSLSERDVATCVDGFRDFNLHRNSAFRQASIPEMDETSSSSDTPFIDADSSGGADSVPRGSGCSSSSTTEAELPCCLDTVSCGESHFASVERRRVRGNMKRSQTWQGTDNACSRNVPDGRCNSSLDENDLDDDFHGLDDVCGRSSRRESWTIPSSNSHLSICLSSSDSPSSGFRNSIDGSASYGNSASMTLQELIQTEIDYIQALKFVIDNYLPEVFKESVPQSLRGKRNVVFGNVTKIYDFHKNDFLQAVRLCETSPFQLGPVFLKFEKQFYLYALYTHNKPKSDELMAECGNVYFKARQTKLQDKMDLSSYLLKPVQRMVKYAGLLKQLLKLCPRSDPEWEKLQEAEEMVKFQLRHGNDLLAMDLLRDCDVNIKEQGRLCRQDDMLVWVAGKKRFRRVFLFEEIILFSKVKRDKQGCEIFQYKNSLKTSDLGLTEQLGDSLTRFEIWYRKRKSGDNYILQAANGDEKQAWTRDISAILWSQAFKGREARLVEMNSMGIEKKTCLDIKPSEDQINHRYVNLRQQGLGSSSSRGSIESLRSSRISHHQRPHSVISIGSHSGGVTSSLISSPVPVMSHWIPDPAAVVLPEDVNESPRRSQCSSESGIGLDTTNSSSPVDSDSSK